MDTIIITRTCPFCGKTYSKTLDRTGYEVGMHEYQAGALIQNAFPTFTPSEREFLKTGICDECWDNM